MPRKVVKKNVCACGHGHGWPMVVVGLLVLANVYWPVLNWPAFVGGLAVVGGLLSMWMPCKCK